MTGTEECKYRKQTDRTMNPYDCVLSPHTHTKMLCSFQYEDPKPCPFGLIIATLEDDLAELRKAVSQHIDSILCLCSEGREFDSPGALLDKVESETKRLLDEIIKGRF